MKLMNSPFLDKPTKPTPPPSSARPMGPAQPPILKPSPAPKTANPNPVKNVPYSQRQFAPNEKDDFLKAATKVGPKYEGKSVEAWRVIKDFKSVSTRNEIAEKVGTPGKPFSPEVNAVIQNMEKNLQKFGPVIDQEEVRSLTTVDKLVEKYWAGQKRMADEMKDQIITREEMVKRKTGSTGWGIFGKWFGWKK